MVFAVRHSTHRIFQWQNIYYPCACKKSNTFIYVCTFWNLIKMPHAWDASAPHRTVPDTRWTRKISIQLGLALIEIGNKSAQKYKIQRYKTKTLMLATKRERKNKEIQTNKWRKSKIYEKQHSNICAEWTCID